MRIEFFLATSIGMFLLLHLLALPRLGKAIRSDRSQRSISWHGLYSLVSLVRSAALISGFVALAMLVCIYAIDLWGAISPARAVEAIAVARACRDVLAQVSTWWVLSGGLLLTAGMFAHAYLQGKRQMRQALTRVMQAQVDTIVEQLKDGSLEPLPPTEPMQRAMAIIEQNMANRHQIEQDESLEEAQRTGLLLEIDDSNNRFETYCINLDIERRINTTLSESEVALPKPSGFWSRLQTLLVSQGLIRTHGIASRIVYAAFLFALIPSFLSFYGTSGAGDVQRRVIALNELRLRLEAENAEQAFEQAIGSEDQAHTITQDDQSVLRRVAAQIEEATLTASDTCARNLPSSTTFALRSAAARQQILSITGTHSGGAFEATPNISITEGLSTNERLLAARAESLREAKAVSRIGDEIYVKLEKAARRQPGLLPRLRSELATFQATARRGQLVAGVLGDVIDGKVDTRMTLRERGLLNDLHRTRTSRAVAELVTGKANLQTAIEVAHVPDRIWTSLDTPDMVQLRTKLQVVPQDADIAAKRLVARLKTERPPSAVVRQHLKWSEGSALSAAEKLKAGYESRLGVLTGRTHKLADVFATYNDYFPGHLGDEAVSVRGRLLKGWNFKAVDSVGRTSFSRSRNFMGLRGFSRVGGVLIGRDPSPMTNAPTSGDPNAGPTFTCRDIQWQWKPDGLYLILVDAQGQHHVSRSHRPRIVQQALSYAADGRPLTVTIVNAEPTPFRQVLLHPTLVDSPLGYRMIELDQFVYRYASDRPEFQARNTAVDQHAVLYQVARAARLNQIEESTAFTPEAKELITTSRAEAEELLKLVRDPHLPLRGIVANSLADEESIRDPRRSPLPSMTDYFDTNLVRLIQNGADATDDPAEFIAYIEREAKRQWKEFADAAHELETGISRAQAGESISPADRTRYLELDQRINVLAQTLFTWVMPAPEWDEASGVRESSFTLEASNLLVGEGSQVPSNLLAFTVQLAFTSPAYFKAADDESLPEPWEFEVLQTLIADEVSEGIANRPTNQEILNDALEFTALQRLFRMALTERLGSDFPCEKLSVLAEELAGRIPNRTYRTPRWDYGELEIPLVASADISISQTLLSVFGLLPKSDGASHVVDAARLQSLAESLGGIAQKLLTREDVADGDRRAVLNTAAILKRRIDGLATFQRIAEEMKAGSLPKDRAQLESAWDDHVAAGAWRAEWEAVPVPESVNREISSDVAAALQAIATVRDTLSLQDALGIPELAKQDMFRAVLEGDKLPPIE